MSIVLDVVSTNALALACRNRLLHAINGKLRNIFKALRLCRNAVHQTMTRVHAKIARRFLRLVQILCFRCDANPMTAVPERARHSRCHCAVTVAIYRDCATHKFLILA
ncbi:MAG: hypothetical protein ACLQFW_25550, partial [Xanthobacteraceae bacterium]